MELVDTATGEVVAGHQPLLLQVSVINGSEHKRLVKNGAVLTDADLDRLTLLVNQQGRPLLVSKAGGGGEGQVTLQLANGVAMLHDLSITDSSVAMLQGQRPSFALWLQAVEPNGTRCAAIPSAVSDLFVVATPRVRSASKPAIPKLSDHVSKLPGVGAATQAKLRDLDKAAREAGLGGLDLPMTSANTVGEFRQMVLWAQEDLARCEKVRRLLGLNRGWDESKDHAMKAVGEDSRLRVFFLDANLSTGLLFGCKDANPLLDSPLALVQAVADASGQHTLRAILLTKEGHAVGQQGQTGSLVQAIKQQAKVCWADRGHPGWALMAMNTEEFERSYSHLQQVLLPAQLAAAAVPRVLNGSTTFHPTAAPAHTGQPGSGPSQPRMRQAVQPGPGAAAAAPAFNAAPVAVGAALAGSSSPARPAGGISHAPALHTQVDQAVILDELHGMLQSPVAANP